MLYLRGTGARRRWVHRLFTLVTGRVALVLVLTALLFCSTGSPWMLLVGAVLSWLVADRLLGRKALHDTWKVVRQRDA